MTVKSPAELMFGRQIQMKLPRMMPKAQGKVAEEARKTHEEERRKQKTYADAKRGAKEKKVEIGDQMMLPQRKTTIKPLWDADPWTFTEVKGSQLRVKQGEKQRLRAKNLVKIIKHRVKDGLGIYKRTRKDMEEPDIDITIEEIHKKIAKEKEQRREPANPGEEEDGEHQEK